MKDKEDKGGDVIHVAFGPEGGRRVEPPTPPPAPPPADASATAARAREPFGDLFRRAEVSRLFDIPEGRLEYWDRSEFLSPSGRVGRRRYYTFQDLIALRAARDLLAGGAPLPAVRRGLENLQKTLPHVTRPLTELRVTAEGHSVVVHDAERAFDAATGQLQMDFQLRDLRDDVVRVLRPERIDPDRRQRAYEAYLEGCRLDEDEASYEAAEKQYQAAIELDPGLANALTNWGNLRFRQGDAEGAEALYHRALAIDEEQPEAYYNLGFLAYDHGQMADAVVLFDKAVAFDPGFADAHFNLAMALEECGRPSDAAPHWKTYLELDPDGPWSRIAREHLVS
ncbi:MAG: tetratricopeptide repeat protein [Sandaracinaceae bacterium]